MNIEITKMINSSKIKEIHDSNLFGIIIEMGCASCISSSLYDIEGASNTIYYSSQPYSKEYQTLLYGESKRSVSYEFVNKVIEKELENTKKIILNKESVILGKNPFKIINDINFILVASFQLQGTNQTNLTHGWIGLYMIESRRMEIYHLSIPYSGRDRQYFLEIISEEGINLLYSKISGKETFRSCFVDNIIINEEVDKRKLLENILDIPGKTTDNYLVFTPDKIIRFEDFCRDQSGIILMKGSFNPIHERHIELLEQSKKIYPHYNAAFLVSVERRDKENLQIEELIQKIEKINSLGYIVIICKQKFFTANLHWIRQRWTLPIIFPVGYDTINRFADDTYSIQQQNKMTISYESYYKSIYSIWKDAKFLVFHRKDVELNANTNLVKEIIQIEKEHLDETGISSTKIRNGEIISKI